MKKLFLILIFFLFLPSFVMGAVTYDTIGHGSCQRVSGSTPLCTNLTYSVSPNSGSNRALVIGVSIGSICGTVDVSISSITYNGSSTGINNQTSAAFDGCADGGNDTLGAQYTLVNEGTGANNIVITPTITSHNIVSTATALQGVDQASPVRNSNITTYQAPSGTTATVTVTTAIGDLIVDFITNGTDMDGAVGADQLSKYTETNNHSTAGSFGTSVQDGVNGGVMSWTITSDMTSISAVSMRAAAAAVISVPVHKTVFNKFRFVFGSNHSFILR